MCRSIKVLRSSGGSPQDTEVREAALQFVRKISGCRQPSRANSECFEVAVEEIAAASRKLLESLHSRSKVAAP